MNPDEAATSIPPVLNRIPLMALKQLVACGRSTFFTIKIKASPQWESDPRQQEVLRAIAASQIHSHCRHLVHLLSALDLTPS